jgi:hypothetical protein
MVKGTRLSLSEQMDDAIIDHLSASEKLMLKIDKLAHEKVDQLLEPVRRGELTLDELKRSRGIL